MNIHKINLFNGVLISILHQVLRSLSTASILFSNRSRTFPIAIKIVQLEGQDQWSYGATSTHRRRLLLKTGASKRQPAKNRWIKHLRQDFQRALHPVLPAKHRHVYKNRPKSMSACSSIHRVAVATVRNPKPRPR